MLMLSLYSDEYFAFVVRENKGAIYCLQDKQNVMHQMNNFSSYNMEPLSMVNVGPQKPLQHSPASIAASCYVLFYIT